MSMQLILTLGALKIQLRMPKPISVRIFASSQAANLESTQPYYDSIFANINRNVLLEQIPSYGQALKEGGGLFLSGFYRSDVEILQKACQKENLTLISTKENEQWCALKFIK